MIGDCFNHCAHGVSMATGAFTKLSYLRAVFRRKTRCVRAPSCPMSTAVAYCRTMRWTSVVVVCAFLLTGLGAGAWASEPVPLSDADRALFWGSPEDPIPKKLEASRRDLEGRHYMAGDEWNLHKFYEAIKNVGGGYMGVGTDQGYLFAGWMKADLAWLIDYDPWVIYLHQAYLVFFRESETKEAFYDCWLKKSKKKSHALLAEKLAGHPELETLLRIFRIAQNQTYYRFLRLRRILKRAGIPSYLTDDAMYSHVRAMVLTGRLRPLRVNLLETKGMVGVADVAKKLNVPVRAIYVSNAEGYWPYPEQYRKNMEAQFVDDKSLLLRTVPKKKRNNDYIYYAQPMSNYNEWLRQDYVHKVHDIVPRVWPRTKKHIPYLFYNEAPFKRAKKRR
jgi:hypothetical protein